MARIFVLTILILTYSCSSTYTISTTPPGAEISAEGKILGKTPIEISSGDIEKRYSNGVILDINLNRYQKIKIWLPDVGKRIATKISLNPMYQRIRGDKDSINSDISRSDLNRFMKLLLTNQKNLLSGDKFDQNFISDTLMANPRLGTAYYLKALSLLKNGKKDESIRHLKEAMRYAPQEYEFLEMYNEIISKN